MKRRLHCRSSIPVGANHVALDLTFRPILVTIPWARRRLKGFHLDQTGIVEDR